MNKLIAIMFFALSLYGCDAGGATYVQRSSVDGNEVLYSQVVSHPGLVRFECLRSASGKCHYTLFPRGCAPASAATQADRSPAATCQPGSAERFALSSGQSRRMAAFSAFRVCVGTQRDAVITDCDSAEWMAAL